jgi:transcriptional regulator with XRE-family HTH domain
MSKPRSRREQRGQGLGNLRKLAGLSGRALATRLSSLTQSTVSRAEGGKALLSRPEVEAWADATGADPQRRAQLLVLSTQRYVRRRRGAASSVKDHTCKMRSATGKPEPARFATSSRP